MILVSCLGDTERLGEDRGQPRVSPSKSARRRAEGQRARPLIRLGASGRRRAGSEGGRYPGRSAHRAGSQGGHAAAVRRRPASSLAWAGAWASAATTWTGSSPRGHGRRHRRGCARRVSQDALHPARRGGEEAQGGTPASPTPPRQPIRVVTRHGLRPPRWSGGGGRRMRRYRLPAPPTRRSRR